MSLANEFGSEGRVWFRRALNDSQLALCETFFETDPSSPGQRLSVSTMPVSLISTLTSLAHALLPGAIPVRAVAFDKSEHANWALPWHRDFVIAVKNRTDVAGYSNWVERPAMWHVRPPIALLRRMLFLRVLLDDTTEESGDLEIALGSHLGAASDTPHDVNPGEAVKLESAFGNRGDVLAVKALVLHKSSTTKLGRRRALRIDFSADDLPEPLKWAN